MTLVIDDIATSRKRGYVAFISEKNAFAYLLLDTVSLEIVKKGRWSALNEGRKSLTYIVLIGIEEIGSLDIDPEENLIAKIDRNGVLTISTLCTDEEVSSLMMDQQNENCKKIMIL